MTEPGSTKTRLNNTFIKIKNMTNTKTMTTQEVANRFDELAQQEKWFEIQDEFFAENVRSVEPANSPYFGYAEGKKAVRKKGEEFTGRIEAAHRLYTTKPLVTGNHFVVAREKDLTVQGHGRIQINQIMLYEVKDGKIVLEQFFY
jgi:ketosteroid isomerase-like protein